MIFRNPAEVNYRAIRDMGLAAWFGSSLMGLAGLVPASESQPDAATRHRVLDAGWKGSRGLVAGSVTAYLAGTGLVRFQGKAFTANGVPRWITEGVENKARTAVTVVALSAAITAKRLRAEGSKLHDQHSGEGVAMEQAEKLRKMAHTMHVIVPAATGYLLYSHLKQDMRRK
ncbi:hypothetical protein [Haloactinomyces albus]|uniref:Uncharacterized protein n=1 Tax=Haloactinomyces albus TaxID=1352928 RepID=A0AAE3Z9P1_9ACTN|nr:hypothetical protein [Haloactinomyces albus]MDR7299895.1 hypothetical protein [Haloactinomyces albus]